MRAFAIFGPLLLSCCGPSDPTVINGASPESYRRTAAQARRDIPDADRLAFDRAIRTIGGRRHSADPDALARVTFNGMTGAEVVADQRARETGGSAR